ncbi:MAG: phosphoribosylanthranilate isomerase [Bacteroidota bacterium]
MDFKIKICGLKHPDNFAAISELQPDYIGLIFYKNSPRYMKDSLTPAMVEETKSKKVGVFVNAAPDELEEIIKEYNLDAIQLHGQESPEYCLKFKERIQVIKAFSISNDFDFKEIAAYVKVCDQFLFDTKGQLAGGNGYAFNWKLLERYEHDVPFFLSGGIGLENIEEAESINNMYLYGIDINSRAELSPGIKDSVIVRKLINKLRNKKL